MNETTYPVEPWELRAYVEEDPSREYLISDPERCIIGRYCNERLDGSWNQKSTSLLGWRDEFDLDPVSYPAPQWAFELMQAFDTTFANPATGKDILEADILPRGDA